MVVGAYGTAQKRLDQVGSAFQVNADQLKALPALRVDKMLDGLIPGVKIDPNTDSPDNTRARYNVRFVEMLLYLLRTSIVGCGWDSYLYR